MTKSKIISKFKSINLNFNNWIFPVQEQLTKIQILVLYPV